MTCLEEYREKEAADPELAEAEWALQSLMQEEGRQRIEDLRSQRRQESAENKARTEQENDDFDDDDYDVEVEYVP